MICEHLEYCRVDKAVLMHIAEEAGIDAEAVLKMEKGFTNRARLVSGEMTSLYRKQRTAFDKKGVIDDLTYTEVVKNALENYARQGDAIIVGRGGQMILRDWPNALHVRLYAPEEVRAQRLVAREGISEAAAIRSIKQSDEHKRQFIRQMFQNADWRNLKYYSLAIDTSKIPMETAARIIVLAAQALDSAD
ncbi:MAG: cytidylate kinase-like family protein [Anaerolineae bacterium]|nr:cytidylate kinase-like family protein [Anaerolineae bacterium]